MTPTGCSWISRSCRGISWICRRPQRSGLRTAPGTRAKRRGLSFRRVCPLPSHLRNQRYVTFHNNLIISVLSERLRDGQEFTQSLSEEFELHNSDVSCPQEFEGTHVGGEGQHGKPTLPPPTPPSPPPPMSSSQPGPLSPKKSPTLSSHPSSPKRSPVRTHALQTL